MGEIGGRMDIEEWNFVEQIILCGVIILSTKEEDIEKEDLVQRWTSVIIQIAHS